MMTPERRAEIERVGTEPGLRDYFTPGAEAHHRGVMISELLAEIDRLNKVVDQAIECARSWHVIYSATRHPELAAELQRRGK